MCVFLSCVVTYAMQTSICHLQSTEPSKNVRCQPSKLELCPKYLSLIYVLSSFRARPRVAISRLTGIFYTLAGLSLLLIVQCNPSIKNPGPERIKIVYCNVQGLIHMHSIGGSSPIFQTQKLLDLQSFLYTHEPDIVILNETWLNSYVSDNEIISDSYYTIFRKDRSDLDKAKYNKKGGGGVMMLCKNNSDVQYTAIQDHTDLPIVSIVAKPKKGPKLCISTFYRYDYSDSESHRSADLYYKGLSKKYKSLTIIGDLNLSSIKDWDMPVTNVNSHSEFLETIDFLGLTSLVNSSTHKAGNNLDLILTNNPSLYSQVVIEQNNLVKSDHFTIQCNINIGVNKKSTKKIRKFAYKKADWDLINKDLSSCNWDFLFNGLDASGCVSRLKSKLDIVLKNHIPMSNVKPASRPPWFDDELKIQRGKVEKLRKKCLKFPEDESLESEYKKASTSYRKSVDDKRATFYTDNELNDSNTISKKFYKYLKSLGGSTRIPDLVSDDEKSSSNCSDKCNMFNKFFCAQFSEPSTYNNSVDLTRNHQNDCNDIIFTDGDVLKILKLINPSKATGPDNIDGIVLKKCAPSLARPLALIFNLSYKTSCLPSEWKEANVVPIHKKGNKSLIKNYRPISLTCLIMKVFEKLIRDKLLEICLDKISPHQHGFVPEKSCCTQMIEFTDSLAYNMNNHMQTDVVYFDFSKAFDSVNHDVIIEKLKKQYNINGRMLGFIIDYLRDRKQRVVLDSGFSEWAPVQSGVPQGSILGPLLFVLFINDITEAISLGTNCKLYADDLKIWKSIHSTLDSLQADIDNLHTWSVQNRMTFHPAKCKVVRSSLNKSLIIHNYTLASQIIPSDNSETDLGVTLSSRLNFEEHRELVISKQKQKLGLLKRNSRIARTANERRALYLSLVRSLLEHCSQVWRPISEPGIVKFEKVQKRAVKWILDEEELSYSHEQYHDKLKKLNIPTIRNKFSANDLVMLHKIIYGLSPLTLPSYISHFSPDMCTRNTRTQARRDVYQLVTTEYPRINAFESSYFYRTHLLWNDLPLSLRQNPDPLSFSTELKKHLYINELSLGEIT